MPSHGGALAGWFPRSDKFDVWTKSNHRILPVKLFHAAVLFVWRLRVGRDGDAKACQEGFTKSHGNDS